MWFTPDTASLKTSMDVASLCAKSCNITEVQQTRPGLSRRAPIARPGTQIPFGHLSLALGTHSEQMIWDSDWQLGQFTCKNSVLLNLAIMTLQPRDSTPNHTSASEDTSSFREGRDTAHDAPSVNSA